MHKSVLLLIVISAIALVFFSSSKYTTHSSNASDNKKAILSDCMSERSPVHYHVTLKINYLGRPLPLPDNIGIEPDCMHPIDTHDGSTGQIHVHYKEHYPFTLGDFFTVWGVIFNRGQIGSTLTSDRRQVRMRVNGQQNTEFENYVMKNGDVIEIAVTPNYSD